MAHCTTTVIPVLQGGGRRQQPPREVVATADMPQYKEPIIHKIQGLPTDPGLESPGAHAKRISHLPKEPKFVAAGEIAKYSTTVCYCKGQSWFCMLSSGFDFITNVYSGAYAEGCINTGCYHSGLRRWLCNLDQAITLGVHRTCDMSDSALALVTRAPLNTSAIQRTTLLHPSHRLLKLDTERHVRSIQAVDRGFSIPTVCSRLKKLGKRSNKVREAFNKNVAMLESHVEAMRERLSREQLRNRQRAEQVVIVLQKHNELIWEHIDDVGEPFWNNWNDLINRILSSRASWSILDAANYDRAMHRPEDHFALERSQSQSSVQQVMLLVKNHDNLVRQHGDLVVGQVYNSWDSFVEQIIDLEGDPSLQDASSNNMVQGNPDALSPADKRRIVRDITRLQYEHNGIVANANVIIKRCNDWMRGVGVKPSGLIGYWDCVEIDAQL